MKVKIRIVKDFSEKEQKELDKIGVHINFGWDAFEVDACKGISADKPDKNPHSALTISDALG